MSVSSEGPATPDVDPIHSCVFSSRGPFDIASNSPHHVAGAVDLAEPIGAIDPPAFSWQIAAPLPQGPEAITSD